MFFTIIVMVNIFITIVINYKIINYNIKNVVKIASLTIKQGWPSRRDLRAVQYII